MSHAIKLAGSWIEIVGDVLLPVGEHGWGVSDIYVAALSPERQSEEGFVEVAEVVRPVGVTITGSQIVEVQGVPTREYIREALSSEALAVLIQHRKDQIDAKAGAIITSAYPLWKQANMTARAVELLDIRSGRELTTGETAEQTALRAAGTWVNAVRGYSGTLKAALPSDGPGAAAFDIAPGWPNPPT